MRLWQGFARRTWGDRARLVEAGSWLIAARILLLLVPFKYLAARLGKQHNQSPVTFDTNPERDQARRIGRAVTTMSRYVPWDSACLAQAVAGKFMLQRRHIPSTLYLGVAKDGDAKMIAHAWLRCGDVIVTGAPQHQRFTVVSTFAEDGSQH